MPSPSVNPAPPEVFSRQGRTIMIIAGEASGDMHAAHLVAALKKLNPQLQFSGLGGPQLAAQGVEIYEDLTRYAVVGFTEVLKHYRHFKRLFDLFLNKAKSIKPDAVILVDYPGFNLRMARALKKLGIRVIYYISPQVWAWKKDRVHTIKRCVDKMLVLFPFELELYQRHGIDAAFVGHPLTDIIAVTKARDKFLRDLNLRDYQFTLGLMPGSRVQEIDRHLPLMLDTAAHLKKEFPMMQFLIIQAPTIPRSLIETHLKKKNPSFLFETRIVENDTYNAINASDFCMVASGTATLEVGLLKKPMIILYRTSQTTFLLAKAFVRIPYIGLINVVAGKKIVPEFIQGAATPPAMTRAIRDLLTNEIKLAEIKSELNKVRSMMETGDASRRAAEEILRFIK